MQAGVLAGGRRRARRQRSERPKFVQRHLRSHGSFLNPVRHFPHSVAVKLICQLPISPNRLKGIRSPTPTLLTPPYVVLPALRSATIDALAITVARCSLSSNELHDIASVRHTVFIGS